MRCEEVRTLIHAYVDRELDWKTRAQLFAHFRRCRDCRGELHDAEELTRAMRSFHTPIPPDVSQRMEARLRAAVGDAEYTRPIHATPAVRKGVLPTIPRRTILTGAAAVAAAAAGIAILARKSQADELDDTIRAMSGLTSARATGTYTGYRFRNEHNEMGVTAPIEYDYRAPGFYRRSTGDESQETGFYPQSIYLQGRSITKTINVQGTMLHLDVKPSELETLLSGFDIFSSDCVLRRIAHDRQGSQIAIEPVVLSGIKTNHIRIRTASSYWELWANQESHLIIRSIYTGTYITGGQRKTEFEEHLDNYDYNLDIPVTTFNPPPATENKSDHSRTSPGALKRKDM